MSHDAERLAIFLPSLECGGAERSMLKLGDGLAKRGYSVDIVLARAKGPHLAEVAPGVRVIDLKASRVLLSVLPLMNYLWREKPDALLSVLDYANIVALWARWLARSSTRVVVNDQNTVSVVSRQSAQARQRLIPQLVKHFYPWADQIIGNSKGVAEDLSEITGLPRSQIRVVYNPVLTPALHEAAKAEADHPWFKANQLPVLLAVGRMTAQKDFPTLIRAFAEIHQARPCRLMILGEGPDRAKLEALIAELGLQSCVSLPGFVQNPYAYMARASLFILSSRWEGLPTVLIEALACGTPVISTDCPSGPHEILAGGKYGELVPVQDVAAMAAAITEALNGNLPLPTAESCRPYELDAVVNEYIDVLVGKSHE
jgi:glycosyltransferase involved in cell wall biosynthesis